MEEIKVIQGFSNVELEETRKYLRRYWNALRDEGSSVGDCLWVILEDIRLLELDRGFELDRSNGRKFDKEIKLVRDFAKFVSKEIRRICTIFMF